MDLPRIVISAPKSGSGKTLITISLIKAFLNRGKKVRAFKCGPDFIDPMFHRQILGVPSKNLDEYFCRGDSGLLRKVFAEQNDAELSLIEGVMGLYDGISVASCKGSTYSLAKSLCAPIVLVVDAKGMARSVIAEIAGFIAMDSEHLIKGIILNNTGLGVYSAVKQEAEERFHVKMLGYFLPQKNLEIKSRYLGLLLPGEIEDLDKKIEKAAGQLEKNVDIDELFRISQTAPALKDADTSRSCENHSAVRIALARDEAFCFYYEDNLRLLKKLGAQIVEFSPIHDKALPENISGIVLGGGYPELFADQLERNKSMIESIRLALKSGIPSVAECGGFIYLHESLQTQDGKIHKMAGAIPGRCFYTGKLVRFGYMSLREKKNCWLCGDEIRGHEFHYFDSTNNGSDAAAQKPVTEKTWECAHISSIHWWGFAHLYYGSNPRFAEHFVKECEKYSPGTFKAEDSLGPKEENEIQAGRKQKDENYKFFQNTKCDKFPCHSGVAPEDFNCLFCYCPLYALGENCGGNFEIKENGIKSCINCNFPHKRENYKKINARFGEIVQLIKDSKEKKR